jgi:hypothetical protein
MFKKYLDKHLQNEFIIFSKSTWTALIFFYQEENERFAFMRWLSRVKRNHRKKSIFSFIYKWDIRSNRRC